MTKIETLRLQRASSENDWTYAKLMRSTWSDGSISFEVDSNRLGFKSFDTFEEAEVFFNHGLWINNDKSFILL